ncbi:cuticle protein 38-like [Homalodisca vitripennis]|uniref:cuticle protein 38-like n=1 Tax=Homalodisca vitripennis TaxID=197043 RepID=UPI001EEC5269|nr:cuticle protein 38-like [Homalodisca vitripennis]
MLATVVLVFAAVLATHAAPAPNSVLYPVLPAAPHAYLVKPYAAAAPVLQPASYSHVSHTQYTSHPVPAVAAVPAVSAVPVVHAAPALYHTPVVYHAPASAALVV